ncbi:unnamed protein product [marine sediment metagenome]|uniref:Uncharacterized protein n=1 Tax=marine sediment metagenome TaxID=412755 RepID=X1Q094_9ZZZZ
MKPEETKEEKALHKATDRALKKFNKAKHPFWNKCYKALTRAWREYEKDIAPLEKTCDREIARASRAYTRATQNKGGEQ